MLSTPRRRHLAFLLFFLLSCFLFRPTLGSLWGLALSDERYTHTILVPFLSALLLFFQRRRIFSLGGSPSLLTLPALLFAILLYGFSSSPANSSPSTTNLSLQVTAVVLIWIAGFAFLYGTTSLRAAIFPLCFLLATIPLPEPWFDLAVTFFQKGSAEAAAILFKLTGVPVFRQGMTFKVPGITIEVAEQCSGIRSSIGLLITGLLAGYLLLRSPQARVTMALVTIPITILKNGVRIVTLTLLGAYVSMDFILGSLHRMSGIPFSILSFSLLFLVLLGLHRLEARGGVRPPVATPSDSGVASKTQPSA